LKLLEGYNSNGVARRKTTIDPGSATRLGPLEDFSQFYWQEVVYDIGFAAEKEEMFADGVSQLHSYQPLD
jgi:hypothetical protein